MGKLLELHVDDGPITSATVPVRWCLTAEGKDAAIEAMVGHKRNELWVLIVTVFGAGTDNMREYRELHPFDQMLAFVPFYRAGVCRVHATVVVGSKSGLRTRLLRHRESGEFRFDAIDDTGEMPSYWASHDLRLFLRARGHSTDDIASVSLEIPAACFAKEPPAWEKRWVNFLWRHKAEDQCDYRRRRLFAYGVQPWLVLALGAIWLVQALARFSLALMWCLGFGFYNFHWAGFFVTPFSMHGEFDAFPIRGDRLRSPFFSAKTAPWRLVLIPFAPALVAIECGLAWVLWRKLDTGLPWWVILAAPGAVLVLAVGAVVVIAALVWLSEIEVVGLLSDLVFKVFAVPVGWLCDTRAGRAVGRATLSLLRWLLLPARMDANRVAAHECPAELAASDKLGAVNAGGATGAGPRRVAVAAIPRQHRTIRLRFEQVKAAVCRPFQQ